MHIHIYTHIHIIDIYWSCTHTYMYICICVYYFIEASLRKFLLADFLLSLPPIHLSPSVNLMQRFTLKKISGLLCPVDHVASGIKAENNF